MQKVCSVSVPTSFQAHTIATKDSNSRLEDEAINKLIFLLTDGEQVGGSKEDLEANARVLKKLPVTVYALGTSRDSNKKQLELIASDPGKARIYESMQSFSNDVADLLYETCYVYESEEEEEEEEEEGEKGEEEEDQNKMIKILRLYEKRYVKIKFSVKADLAIVRMRSKFFKLKLLASHRQDYPSNADFDSEAHCGVKEQCVLKLQDPEKYLENICKEGQFCTSITKNPGLLEWNLYWRLLLSVFSVGKKDKDFTVAIETTGPDDCTQCVEDVKLEVEERIGKGGGGGGKDGGTGKQETNKNKDSRFSTSASLRSKLLLVIIALTGI